MSYYDQQKNLWSKIRQECNKFNANIAQSDRRNSENFEKNPGESKSQFTLFLSLLRASFGLGQVGQVST